MADAGRIIAGTARGIRLRAAGPATRPMADRVKQTAFGILDAGTLGPWPTPFLDVFAGAAAAASRPSAVARPGRRSWNAIDERWRRSGPTSRPAASAARAVILDGDAVATLMASPPPVALADGPFGAALLDPPYGDATLMLTLERLAEPGSGWLAEEAVVVAKHFWRDLPPERIGRLSRVRERRFGETTLTFYATDAAS